MNISPAFAKFPRSIMVALLMLLFPAMAADRAPGQAASPTSAQRREPAHFVPTEKVKADTVVDFPVDI